MSTVIVIPARYASTRFPGKPLAMIAGKSMLERTWLIANAVQNVDDIVIATDDKRIEEHAIGFGARVQITSSNCQNGTERVWQALENLNMQPDIIVNLQGDALLTPPWVIQALVDKLRTDSQVKLATAATQLNQEQYVEILQQKSNGAAGGTFVTFDQRGKALYFSKSVIPFLRNGPSSLGETKLLPIFRHIGLYAYRYTTLAEYICLKPTLLETTEGLEQLRALESGIPINIVLVDYQGRTHWSIDNQDDVDVAEKLISQEGELV